MPLRYSKALVLCLEAMAIARLKLGNSGARKGSLCHSLNASFQDFPGHSAPHSLLTRLVCMCVTVHV